MLIHFFDLEQNWRGRSGFACLFTPHNNQAEYFPWPDGRDQMLKTAAAHDQVGDVYTGWCLYDQPSRQSEHVRVVPGVLFDVDLNTGRHAAKDYPNSEEEALEVVRQSPLPEPTRIIRSGGGLYLHYLFDVPFEIDTEHDRARVRVVLRGMHQLLQGAFRAAGYRLDNVSDLARITRPIGTVNHKYGSDVRVLMMQEGQARYKIEDLEALIGSGAKFSDAVRPIAVEAVDADRKGRFELVEQHCGFVRGMHSAPGAVTEPKWYAAATIAAHCHDGDERFHALSGLDKTRYNPTETANKLRHARGVKPRTCASIEADLNCEACKRCPFRGADINSPYALAFGDPELLRLQEDYILVGETYHCIAREEPAAQRKAFDNLFAHRVQRPHVAFVSDRRSPKARTIDYMPGNDRLVLDMAGVPTLNMWREGGPQPEPGDCKVILEHFSYLVPRADEQAWCLDYLAHLLQKPMVKIQSGITLIGGQGVGKSFIAKLVQSLFGTKNVFVDDAGVHASDYKLQLGNRQVLIIEEMATAQKWEVSNSIKPWFTDDKVRAHEKFLPIRDVRTPRGIFILTNHAVPAVLEMDDRRNAVFRIDAAPREGVYYERLWDAGLKEVAHFKNFLLDRDITTWSPNARPPMTEAKQEIIISSRTPVAMEIDDYVRSSGKELFTVTDLLSRLNLSSQLPRFGRKQITSAMHELGYRKLPKTKLSSGQTVDLWAATNTQHWLEAEHAERKAYREGRETSTGRILALVADSSSGSTSVSASR